MRLPVQVAWPAAWVLAVGSITGCSSGGGGTTGPRATARVRAELVRLPGGSASAPAPPAWISRTSTIGPFPWTSQVTLTSVRAPILGISLHRTDGGSAMLYSCASSVPSSCLVELDGPALQALLGTEAVLMAISPALVIEDGSTATTTIRLYFDIVDLASAALASLNVSAMAVGGRCTPTVLGSTPLVCAAYPQVVALAGTTPPTVEHYRVNNAATIGLFFAPGTDQFLGGYFRRYFVEDQVWQPGFAPDGSIPTFTANGGGTYTIAQGPGGATFPAWQRATHSGTFMMGGNSVPYTATRFTTPP